MEGQIFGDPTRRAVESLRGYAYQLYASAIAWMTLAQDGFLHLEVAEDFATLVGKRLDAVQVKATATSITLNSKPVLDTIDSFFDLKARNPQRVVSVEYLTTAVIGREAAAEDLVLGEAGLIYWQRAAEGADIAPLRARLLKSPLKRPAKDFIESASDDQLRADLLSKLNWRCGEPPLEDLKQSLQDFAIYRCDEKHEPIHFAEAFADAVLVRVLNVIVTRGQEHLTKAELLRLFEKVTKVTVPASALQNLLQSVEGGTNQLLGKPEILEPVADPASVRAERKPLVEMAEASLRSRGVAWLYAGEGYGKSTLASILAERSGAQWKVARFGGLDPLATATKLRRVSTEIAVAAGNVIADDLEHLAVPEVQNAILALLGVAKRQSVALVLTSSQPPTPMRLRAWSLDPETLVPVPDFTEDEVEELVKAEGGSAKRFGRYVYFGSMGGHPQLAHALLLGLKDRGWPESDIETLPAISGTDADLQAVRQEVRQRLLAELRDEELQLLARLTFVVGPFSRNFALSLAEKEPAIALPGKALDRLLGPWIDPAAKDKFRTSSLVSGLGIQIIGPKDVIRFNSEIAKLRIRGNTIHANEADGILLNALIGEADEVLTDIFAAAIGSPKDELPRLAQAMSMLLVLRTDQPIYSKSPLVSARLRLLQVVLLAASGDGRRLPPALVALDSELESLPDGDYAGVLTWGALTKLAFCEGVFDILPGFVSRLAAVRHAPAFARYVQKSFAKFQGETPTPDHVVRTLFALQIATIKKMSSLFRLLDEFAALSADDKAFFIGEFEVSPGDKALAVRGPWHVGLSNGAPGSASLVSEYVQLAEKALEIEDYEIAAAAYETAATICDEDLGKPEDALELLNTALAKISRYRWSLLRTRARVLLHMGRYSEQLQTSAELLSVEGRSNVEMAYFLRETAMACAHLRMHPAAADYFGHAADQASKCDLSDLKLMALGLRVDAAMELFNAGEKSRVVSAFADALQELAKVNPADGLRQKALCAYIPHSLSAIYKRLTPNGPDPEFPLIVFPGLNGNPNPDPAIADFRTAPIDLAWVLLAQVEALVGPDKCVRDLLRSPAWDRRIPTLADHILNQEQFRTSFLTGEVEEFCNTVPRLVAGRIWTSGPSAENLTPYNSPLGRVPSISTQELAGFGSFLTGSALMFIACQALDGRSESVDDFLARQSTLPVALVSASGIKSFRAADIMTAGSDPECSALGALQQSIADGRQLSADEIFVIGIRLYQLHVYDPSEAVLDKAYRWMIDQWEQVVTHQRFRLRNPNGAVEALDRQKARERNGSVGIPELTLALRHHVGVRVPEEIINQLRAAV
ncbi:tetratricopeptide repeat protein [Ensifer sp. ENS12]|uniref:tetratricopeptide repeat protein n=1 Tax=Ensifer sp. ENS12 TaxID=2854774 RepID=UPI001C436FE4|nr:tetratricopeptide repeat protein [Ensifer sp. ENS12]MBV7518970.1 tetratricopeptide repeat protein [Ensifer sp. ENS12]